MCSTKLVRLCSVVLHTRTCIHLQERKYLSVDEPSHSTVHTVSGARLVTSAGFWISPSHRDSRHSSQRVVAPSQGRNKCLSSSPVLIALSSGQNEHITHCSRRLLSTHSEFKQLIKTRRLFIHHAPLCRPFIWCSPFHNTLLSSDVPYRHGPHAPNADECIGHPRANLIKKIATVVANMDTSKLCATLHLHHSSPSQENRTTPQWANKYIISTIILIMFLSSQALHHRCMSSSMSTVQQSVWKSTPEKQSRLLAKTPITACRWQKWPPLQPSDPRLYTNLWELIQVLDTISVTVCYNDQIKQLSLLVVPPIDRHCLAQTGYTGLHCTGNN